MISPTILWFVCGIILFLSEFVVPGFVLAFFGIGALITSLTTWIGLSPNITLQLIIFTIASIVSLVALRKLFKKQFIGITQNRQNPEQNFNEFIGQEVTIIDEIQPKHPGQVEFKGAPWKAQSSEKLSPGETGYIQAVDSLTLTVGKNSNISY